jgi:hypothetical protein
MTVDVGAHRILANHVIRCRAPGQLLQSNGLGCMGYAVPAAIGASLAAPGRRVLALSGDGGLMFTLPELAAAAALGLALPVVVFVNDGYGEIRNEMADAGFAPIGVDIPAPDLPAAARALGCAGAHAPAPDALAAEIAAAFERSSGFFSSVGGSPLSCEIGIAVLDVMRDERLQENALRVGTRLRDRLRELAERHALIGAVHGHGLYLGVELVRDRETLEPAGEEASFVANRFRELGILLGTDGPWHNVVKIRPPMPFGEADADRLVETFERVLAEELEKGTQRRVAEGKARRAAMIEARRKAGEA